MRTPDDETQEQVLRRRADELLQALTRHHPEIFESFNETRTAWKNLQASLIWFQHRDEGTLHPDDEVAIG